jgi:YVTN family beta-propeller protein
VLVLGYTPAGAEVRVFVTNEKSDDVTVIDAATRAVASCASRRHAVAPLTGSTAPLYYRPTSTTKEVSPPALPG